MRTYTVQHVLRTHKQVQPYTSPNLCVEAAPSAPIESSHLGQRRRLIDPDLILVHNQRWRH